MAKKRKEAYLSPRKVLSEEELEEYKNAKQIIERQRLLQEMEKRRKTLKALSSQVRYKKSIAGRVGRRIASGLQFVSSPSSYIYSRSKLAVPVFNKGKQTVPGRSIGHVGRPRGSYKSLYAAYGGVYGWRKAQALERFKQRQQILQAQAITPQQQMILQQIRAREQAQRMSPESHVFPDTAGEVNMNNIFREIEELSNIAG